MSSIAHVASTRWQEFKILSIVVIMASCSMLGSDIHLPSLPQIMVDLNTNQVQMQQSISLFLLGLGLSMLVYGPLSDRHGRKPLVLLGLSVAAIASFAVLWVQTSQSFLMLRFMQGAGSGVCMGLGRTIMADLFHGQRLAILGSYIGMVLGVSPVLAPLVGGYVQYHCGWRANFVVLGSILSAMMVLYAWQVPETNQHKQAAPLRLMGVLQSYTMLLCDKVFVCMVLLSGAAMAAGMAYATKSAFILQQQFQLTPIAYGWVTGIAGIGNLLGKFVNPIVIRHSNWRTALGAGVVGILVSGLILLALVLCQLLTVVTLIIMVFICTAAQMIVLPNTMACAMSRFQANKGAAGAVYGSFQMLVACVSSAVISVFNDGSSVLAWAYILLGIMVCLLFYSVRHLTTDMGK